MRQTPHEILTIGPLAASDGATLARPSAPPGAAARAAGLRGGGN
ncbi:MAG TPA: hypothetical protein VN720_05250 [Rudaea sp.]|nr:hypothetical protein [Rudaea sp.]